MTLLDCLAWIPCLWLDGVADLFIASKEEKFISPFPDDVAIEILVRLPADDIIKCRKLCRRCESLTSTPYFIERHLKRATPSLFLQADPTLQFDKYFICHEHGYKYLDYLEIDASLLKLKKKKDYKPCLVGSCDGLLLFETTLKAPKFFIINPVTQEQVCINPPPGTNGKVCAIFFHPPTRDYKVLYWQHLRSHHFQYFTYSLRARAWKQISSFSFRPTKFVNSTVILNGCLHWMVDYKLSPRINNSIMIYRIEKEDFRAMPRPGHERRDCQWSPDLYLFQMDERLTFCHMRLGGMAIEIWVLRDYENWGWVKRYEVQLSGLENRFHSYYCCDYCISHFWPERDCLEESLPKKIKLLGIQNDELLFDWLSKGIFRYQLKHNEILRVYFAEELPRSHVHWGLTVAYTKSLVSPVDVWSNKHASWGNIFCI